jgi:hypothetical protein
MKRVSRSSRAGALLLVAFLWTVPALAQTTIERQSFSAASGELSGPGIVAQTTLGEAVTGVSGSDEIVAGSGTTYWTETPELFVEPGLLLSAITAPVDPVPVGTEITASAQILASPVEQVALLWSWGDGTTETGVRDPSDDSVTASHTYTAPGVYRILLEASAGDLVDTATFEYVVVYDPDGGFVTGGGWIDSPAGAYAPDPALVGRASFGFVSRYRRGQSQPDGTTQFQFQAAGLSFNSTSYEWLVVSGARAQYKGEGLINEAGDFGFLVTAIDADRPGGGDVDRLRVKIWDRTDGLDVVVYDNGLGEADDSDASTALGGGRITIQEGGGRPRSEIDSDAGEAPLVNAMEPAYPNPVSGLGTLGFSLAEDAFVSIHLYDVVGRLVARLVDAERPAGRHAAHIDSGLLASGVYILRLRTSTGFEAVQRITVSR